MQRHEQERREFESGMKERDAVLRTKIRQHDPRLWWAQIKEDLSRLQVIDRELTQATSREGPVDLKLVTKAVSEIRKRASRIKSNLALPKAERRLEPSRPMAWAGGGPLRPAVSKLSELVRGLADNVVLRNPQIVDVEESAKARRDLEAVIALSDEVKQNGERLRKGGVAAW